jgi:hypothetical protein
MVLPSTELCVKNRALVSGDLVSGEVNIAIAAMTMTSERAEVVDFVAPYFDQARFYENPFPTKNFPKNLNLQILNTFPSINNRYIYVPTYIHLSIMDNKLGFEGIV